VTFLGAYRPVTWFSTATGAPPPRADHLLGGDPGTGLKRLTAEGPIVKDQRLRDPATGWRFRTVYTNRFTILTRWVVQAQTIG
jgi:hypothetical protein